MRTAANNPRVRYACLAALGLLVVTGCGDDRPMVMASPRPYRPAAARQLPDVTPTPIRDTDPILPPDPMAGIADDTPTDFLAPASQDATPDALADEGTDLAATVGPKMPTQHSHWLSVSQFGARVTVRLNGVWYGEFGGAALRDITMRLQPGPNTLTVTYAPQRADAWLAVHLTEGEHTPPVPDLVTYRVAPLRETGGGSTAGRPAPTTRTFRFSAQ